MKKLMILGGSRYILPVIDAAHNLGCYVITCDYLPNNIAHKYSDEYVNVSIIDKEKVLDVATKLKIDGIMSFACDPGVLTAAYVAEKLNLPSCGPYKSVQILQNKGKFRDFLRQNGFNVPMAKSYKSISEALKDKDLFSWPVIVKPTDSAGSKGVAKVEKIDDLELSIRNALKYSHCDEFIIEDFLEKKGNSSDCDSFSVNGELKYVSFSSQMFDDKSSNQYVPSAYYWPSSISKKNKNELTIEIQRLLKLLNMKTSVYNIETRECQNGKTYIMECSPRGGGNRLSEMMKYVDNVDLLTNSVRAALGDNINDGFKIKKTDFYWCEVILHSTKSGIFEGLNISDKIKKNIVENDLWILNGDRINSFNGANEAIGTMILKFKLKSEMLEFLNNQCNYIQIKVR